MDSAMLYQSSDSRSTVAKAHDVPHRPSRGDRLTLQSVALEDQILDGVRKILGPNGLLHQAGGGLHFSPHQYEYAKRAASGFCRYDHVEKKAAINMLQAATGTGKTVAYLVPLMLYAAYTGERVAVSTFTRQLQRQIIESDAATVANWVSQVTGKPLKLAYRLGIGNYVSALACAKLIDRLSAEDSALHDEAIEFLGVLQEWAERQDAHGELVHSGILEDFLSEMNLPRLPDAIPAAFIRLSYQSPQEEQQRQERATSQQRDAPSKARHLTIRE